MEVWVGTSDHLVRRITFDIDTITDASLAGGFGLGSEPEAVPQSHVVRPSPSPQLAHNPGTRSWTSPTSTSQSTSRRRPSR